MAVDLVVDMHGLIVSHFDGQNQLIPYVGYFVEGKAPYVPDDLGPGYVMFEEQSLSELARMLFCDLGFTAEQVLQLLEVF